MFILYIYNNNSTKEAAITVILRSSSPKPIYSQIFDQTRDQILQGVLTEGEALPSIRALARDLRVSVITVKRAYDDLESDGFVETIQGKGCFVAVKNRELLRERRIRDIEETLERATDDAKRLGLGLDELVTMLGVIYGEDGDGGQS